MDVVVKEFAFLKPIIAIVVNLLPDLLKGLVPKVKEESLATCTEMLLMSWTLLAEENPLPWDVRRLLWMVENSKSRVG